MLLLDCHHHHLFFFRLSSFSASAARGLASTASAVSLLSLLHSTTTDWYRFRPCLSVVHRGYSSASSKCCSSSSSSSTKGYNRSNFIALGSTSSNNNNNSTKRSDNRRMAESRRRAADDTDNTSLNLLQQQHDNNHHHAITAKVQLHVHLDGAIRIESILPLAKKRGISLPCENFEELREKVIMTKPETLTTFLARFKYWAPTLHGDLDAVRQLSAEFAEDMAKDNVIYCEARYCPHLLIGDSTLTADQIVEAVCDTFAQCEKKYNIKLRTILCCMRFMPEISLDIVRLCDKYRNQGVVAIDIAGDENMVENGEPTQQAHMDAFRIAKEKGIFRTVHAGENGSSAVVKEAVDEMFANRVGHGYRTLQDECLYQRLLRERMHFEMCPWSSILTGASPAEWKNHSIKRFAKDDANFSLNTDDPTVTQTSLSDEYTMNFDAARSAFLPDAEREEVIAMLRKAYAHIKETKDF